MRNDYSLRVQMPSACTIACGGPDEHGARPREPRATARPSADRVRRDGACRREVPGRPDEALVEARLWRPVAAADRQAARQDGLPGAAQGMVDRKSTRLNSSHTVISYAVFCLKKKRKTK